MQTPSIILSNPPSFLKGKLELTGSKSESNRALILQAQSQGALTIHNLSIAEDTTTLKNLLFKVENRIHEEELFLDVGPAGTVMRFLTAYLSLKSGIYILSGSSRMLERPIQILVDALISLGAEIEYLGKKGYPPLRIKGKKWTGNFIKIPASISSQYISALLLVAPFTTDGLEIILEGDLTSAPYVDMTVKMMEQIGLKIQKTYKSYIVPPQIIPKSTLSIEPDWSGASYWYEMAAFASEADLELSGLKENSLQGDRAIADIMTNFGVTTIFKESGVTLQKKHSYSKPPTYLDFKPCPDIAQTMMVVACGIGINLSCSGLKTLKIKETDRVEAMKSEVAKIQVEMRYKKPSSPLDDLDQIEILGENSGFPSEISFNTYHDHRMAMALAPLVYFISKVEIENKHIVDKSYPSFWQDLEKLGFQVV